MLIDVKEFVAQQGALINSSIETKNYLPKLKAELVKVSNALRDVELTNTVIGRQILGHSYGYEIALLFKKWIFSNYKINNENGIYDRTTDKTVLA